MRPIQVLVILNIKFALSFILQSCRKVIDSNFEKILEGMKNPNMKWFETLKDRYPKIGGWKASCYVLLFVITLEQLRNVITMT